VRSVFVAFNTLAHVSSPLPRTQRTLMRATTPVAPKTGVVGESLGMSVSELKQILSPFVIVCGVLAAATM
jgi:hypothetical protein